MIAQAEMIIALGEMSDYVVRSVVRGLDVLIALAELGRGASNAELAELVGLHPTTSLRMLESLASRQLVRPLPDGGYDLGPRALDIGNAFVRRLSIARHANEIAQGLSDQVGETASVGVLDEGRVLYVAITNGQSDLGIQSVPFGRHPLYCTALGKALIAHLPWAEAERLLQLLPMERLTAGTITSLEALRRALELTRRRGWAIDDGERTAGVTCIAAPIRDFSGRVVAALSISGADFRLAARGIDKLAATVVAAAESASARLGAGPAAPPGRRGRRA
jgi:IclR family acetate operon transcriptional repressor